MGLDGLMGLGFFLPPLSLIVSLQLPIFFFPHILDGFVAEAIILVYLLLF